MAAASQKYFTDARQILDKLDKLVQGGRTPAPLSAIGIWLKRDATAISRLPISNVDPDLVKFAADVSVRLNDAARVIGGGTLQTQARTVGIRSGVVDSYAYSWDYAGSLNKSAAAQSGMATALAQRQQATAEEKAKALAEAGEIFKGVKAEAQQIRIEMTNRYKMEF